MILVTGSTGRIGRDVVFGLVLKDVQMRVMMYGGAGQEWLHWSNVETVRGDYAKPETLDAALVGIESAFMVSGPSPKQVELQKNFIDACVRAGVKHVVKVSALGAAADAPCRFLRWHAETEAQLAASGMRVTNLRPNGFSSNVRDQIESIRSGAIGSTLDPATRISLVDTHDVADIAVAKLSERSGPSENIDITGPSALTQVDVAELLTTITKHPVAYKQFTPDEYRDVMKYAHVPAEVAAGVMELNTMYDAGFGSDVSDATQRIAGNAPTPIKDYLTKLKSKLL